MVGDVAEHAGGRKTGHLPRAASSSPYFSNMYGSRVHFWHVECSTTNDRTSSLLSMAEASAASFRVWAGSSSTYALIRVEYRTTDCWGARDRCEKKKSECDVACVRHFGRVPPSAARTPPPPFHGSRALRVAVAHLVFGVRVVHQADEGTLGQQREPLQVLQRSWAPIHPQRRLTLGPALSSGRPDPSRAPARCLARGQAYL